MNKLSIIAESVVIEGHLLSLINDNLRTLERTIAIDFADTGFYLKTGYQRVLLTVRIDRVSEVQTVFEMTNPDSSLSVSVSVPSSRFDSDSKNLFWSLEYLKAEAAEALANVLRKFNLDSRSMDMRVFHIKGQLNGQAMRAKLDVLDEEDEKLEELQIHMKLSDEGFGSTEDIDFFLQEFDATVVALIEEVNLGFVEGNEVGNGWFDLYCVGAPEPILERLKSYLVKSSRSQEDHVTIVANGQKTSIAIHKLGSE